MMRRQTLVTAIVYATCWFSATQPGMGRDSLPDLAPSFELQGELVEASRAVDPPWATELAALRQRIDDLENFAGDQEQAEKAAIQKEAKKPEVNWTAELQADFYAFNQDDASRLSVGDIENGEAFRRARIGMWGHYGPSEYRLEVDFAQEGRPSFLDVYAGLNDLPLLGRVRVGHFLEPFSIDRVQSNRYLTFMERGLPSQAFSPGRNMGLMANNTWLGEGGTWGIGLFRTDSDVWGDAQGDGSDTAITSRVTCLPWYDSSCPDSRYFHVGMSGSGRDAADNTIRFRARPEAQLGSTFPNVPFFVDTGFIPADSFMLLGLEAAIVDGPFSVQAEYFHVPVDSIGFGSLGFDGWYVQSTYFLTGEHRSYLREYGVFTRLHPYRDFLRFAGEDDDYFVRGPGAWEVAVRLSRLDLNDGDIRGGVLTDLSIGLNWYLNPYMRVTSNYIHAFLDDSNGLESGTDIFALRLGYEF